jgi:hypothetical protein
LVRLVPEPLVRRVLDTVDRSPAAPVVRAAAEAMARRWRSWTPARRRIALAAGAAVLTIAAVTAVVPGGAVASGGAVATGPAGGSATTARPSGAASGAQNTAPPVPPGTAAQMTDRAVTGDDALAASRALIQARERCLSSLSLPCLDRVDEPGSGALEDDQAVIRVAQQGGELPDPMAGAAGGSTPVIVERLGDSALVRLGEAASGIDDDAPRDSSTTASPSPQRGPASLLLVKSEAGWRIRDVIAAG